MKINRTTGYTKEEYYGVSEKQGLPRRYPILADCCRAVETRYKMGMNLGGAGISFEEFLHKTGQRWDPEGMIKNLSVNSSNFPPADNGRSRMKKRFIALGKFLIANEEFPEPIEPGMGHLHNPPTVLGWTPASPVLACHPRGIAP